MALCGGWRPRGCPTSVFHRPPGVHPCRDVALRDYDIPSLFGPPFLKSLFFRYFRYVGVRSFFVIRFSFVLSLPVSCACIDDSRFSRCICGSHTTLPTSSMHLSAERRLFQHRSPTSNEPIPFAATLCAQVYTKTTHLPQAPTTFTLNY